MSIEQQASLIIIAGPTGVGKSDVGLALASHINGEIVNADSGQLYCPLSIGTAKPDLTATQIPHHLFDHLENPVDYTVTQYRHDLLKTVALVQSHNHYPVIVGGSSFYLSSVFFPPQAQTTTTTEYSIPLDKTSQELWELLYSIDRLRADNIHPHDTYRVKRALEIWYKTGQKPSEYQPVYNPPGPYFFITCVRDRDELYHRINQRTEYMIEHGWIEEVEQLMGTEWEPFLLRKKIIGYDDIILYLQKKRSMCKSELIERIAQKTRNYAKRQLIFLKMLQKRLKQHNVQTKAPQGHIIEVNLTNLDVDLYIKQLSDEITTMVEI